MASKSPRKRLRQEVTCPVCLKYFANPVTLACEHTFCHACTLYSPTSALCPICQKPFRPEDMKLNYDLASFVKISKLLNDQEEAGRQGTCRKHLEPLKLFCKDHEVLICTSCEKEHQGHSLVPVEEAAQEYKNLLHAVTTSNKINLDMNLFFLEDRISASLEALKKQKEELMATILAIAVETEDLFRQMETERQKTMVKLQDLRPFLKKQKDRMLARVEQTKQQMVMQKERHMELLSEPLCILRDLIIELEEKRQLPACQLMQDSGRILKWSKKKVEFKHPVAVPLVIKHKMSHFTDSGPSLDRAIKKLKDSVASCYKPAESKCHSGPSRGC